jgi:hypothetical protein
MLSVETELNSSLASVHHPSRPSSASRCHPVSVYFRAPLWTFMGRRFASAGPMRFSLGGMPEPGSMQITSRCILPKSREPTCKLRIPSYVASRKASHSPSAQQCVSLMILRTTIVPTRTSVTEPNQAGVTQTSHRPWSFGMIVLKRKCRSGTSLDKAILTIALVRASGSDPTRTGVTPVPHQYRPVGVAAPTLTPTLPYIVQTHCFPLLMIWTQRRILPRSFSA